MTKHISPISQMVADLGGLEDKHLKLLCYLLKQELKIDNFEIDIDYNSKPKCLTIHAFTAGENCFELYIRPKDLNLLDKLVVYLVLPQWKFKFAVRG